MTDREGFGPKYKGPLGDYKPEIGHDRPGLSVNSGAAGYQGYHNIDLLRNLLKQIKNEVAFIVEKTESTLTNYNLQTLTTTLQDVQKADWPEDLGDPKDYISYEQYKAYEHIDTRGARYVRKAYEDTIRGPAGTCALDIQIIASEIKAEAERIEGFLDDYLGSINDSAEYRILEAFQDWAYVALKYARIFRGIFDSDNENAPTIPEEDVTKLSKDQAKSFQTLFKTKINAFNDEIVRTLEDIKRENAFQEQFYRDFLGPSVKFRIGFGKEISRSTVGGFFGAQADSANKVFVDQIESAVADQVKRNLMFEKRFNELEVRIKARNAYAAYIAQLAPHGAPVKKPFVDTQISQEEKDGFKALAEAAIQAKEEKNTFRSSHGDLADITTEEAHPQYFPKAGGTVSGDIHLDEDVKIDGVRPSTHNHLGSDVDGSEQIPGAGIQPATMQTNVVDRTESVIVPSNLRVVLENQDEAGKANVDLKVAWDVDESAAGYQFEVQFVKYFTGAEAACLVGHPNEYPENPCDPGENGRIYLNTGETLFFVSGETPSNTVGPVYPTDADPMYQMTSTFVVPMTDQVFIAGYDAPRTDSVPPIFDADHVDFRLALCARETTDSLSYNKLNTLSVSDNAESYVSQGYVAGVKVNSTDILTGHINEYGPGALTANKAPTIVLTRASVATDYLSGSLSIVDFTKLLPVNVFESFSGVTSICMANDITWVATIPAVPVLGEANTYIQVGSLAKSPGGSTYDVINCDENDYIMVSQGHNAHAHSQAIRMTDSKVVVLYGEDTNTAGIEPGWYTRVITISGTSYVSMGDPVMVADNTTTTTNPRLSRLSSSEYVVVWGEANTAEACP